MKVVFLVSRGHKIKKYRASLFEVFVETVFDYHLFLPVICLYPDPVVANFIFLGNR